MARGFEPWMLIAGVIHHQFDHHLQAAMMSSVEERLEIAQRSIRGVDIGVVGDVVSIVAQWRWEERQEPDAGDPQVLQIIETRQQSREITDAVVIRIRKRANMELIDNRILVPEGIRCACDLLHAFALPKTSVGTPSLNSAHAKDVRRLNPRPQRHIIAGSPSVLNTVQQVVDKKTFTCGTADLVEVEIRPAALLVE